MELLGNVYVAILVGNVLTVLASMNRESEKHRERMAGIQGLMTQFRLPKHLRRQLRKWVVRPPSAGKFDVTSCALSDVGVFTAPQMDSSGGTAETADILPELPDDLRRSVLLVTMGKTVEGLKFFNVRVLQLRAWRGSLTSVPWPMTVCPDRCSMV